jgi:hypothetical protein
MNHTMRTTLLLALLLAAPLALAEPNDGQRGGFEIAWSLEGFYQGGDELYLRGVQFNMIGRARWFDLWIGVAGQHENSRPPLSLPDDTNFVWTRAGLAGPWRFTPYLEYGSDFEDGLSSNPGGASPTDPTDYDEAYGLRWRANDHMIVSLFHRKVFLFGIDQVAPLPNVDRVFEQDGISIAWEFGWSHARP